MFISLTVINISIYVYIYSQNMKLCTLNIAIFTYQSGFNEVGKKEMIFFRFSLF